MEFITELGLFSSKVLVLVFGIGSLLVLLFALIIKARGSKPTLTVENLNRRFEELANALRAQVLNDKLLKLEQKAQKKRFKEQKTKTDAKRIYVIEFVGDIRASHVDNLREEITAILTMARPGIDEVVAKVESPGGMAHAYGLAAAQLNRIRQAQISLTVCVDKVAASGGYLMACTGHRILAAPFAIVGSIGVVVQIPNFHRLLKKNDVDFEEVTAGEFKRTVTLFGEITEKGRQKLHEQIEDTHKLFKEFVKTCRPQLNLEQVATGEYWYGEQARALNLVDEIISSDDYLFNQRDHAQIFKVEIKTRQKLSEKLAEGFSTVAARTLEKVMTRSNTYGL